MKKHLISSLVIVGLVLSMLGFQVSSMKASPGLVTDDLDAGLTATDLVSSLLGSGVTVSKITYTGINNAAGTGKDTIEATATMGQSSQTSNQAHKTWEAPRAMPFILLLLTDAEIFSLGAVLFRTVSLFRCNILFRVATCRRHYLGATHQLLPRVSS